MPEDRITIEFIGLKLPSSNPVVSMKRLTHQLSRQEVKAMNEIDDGLVSLVRLPACRSTYRLGKKDGLSQEHEWSWRNNYIQRVRASDARIILRDLVESRLFRNLDDPRDMDRKPDYPTPALILLTQVTRGPHQHRLGRNHARFIRRMRGVARGDINPTILGQRIMKYEAPDGSR